MVSFAANNPRPASVSVMSLFGRPALAPRVLEAARAIRDEWDRSAALTALAPRLAELGQPAESLEAARAMESQWDRSAAPAAPAPRLAELGQPAESLEAARAMESQWDRSAALARWPPAWRSWANRPSRWRRRGRWSPSGTGPPRVVGRVFSTALNTARTGSISAFQLDQQFGSFGFGSGLSHDFAPVHRLALAFGHACRTIR